MLWMAQVQGALMLVNRCRVDLAATVPRECGHTRHNLKTLQVEDSRGPQCDVEGSIAVQTAHAWRPMLRTHLFVQREGPQPGH